MDWNNIDLKSPRERDLNILEPSTFEILLLEIQCNIKDINEATILAQFEADLQSKIESAREIIKANLSNILNEALEDISAE